MKRVFLALLSGMLFCTIAMAQMSGFNQRGRATKEMGSNGLTIAHPSLPINSSATVTNTATGKQVDVTVFNRIPASSIRIADLSDGVWQALELNPNTDILITTGTTVRAPQPAPGLPPAPERAERYR